LIKNCIDTYLSTRPNINIPSISKRSAIPETTLRRIFNLEGNPRPRTVIALFNSIGEDEFLYKYMSEFHPEISTVMAKKFSHNKEYKYVEEDNKKYYSSEDYFLILNLASTRSGTTQDEVAYTLGVVGIERLNHLVDQGLITLNNGRYFSTNSNFKLSFHDTKKRISLSLKHYRISEAGSVHNWMSFQTESINKEGLKALKSLNQKHFNDRKDMIYNNPMYKGDIKHYSASISSTFLPYKEEGELQ
jgi:hypothetical protein